MGVTGGQVKDSSSCVGEPLGPKEGNGSLSTGLRGFWGGRIDGICNERVTSGILPGITGMDGNSITMVMLDS